jgi:phage baseplate assembly protein gpV
VSDNPIETLMAPQTEYARQRLVHGLITAKVKSNEGNGLYRLDYLHIGDGVPSALARVMMPMAGGKRGFYFFPEVGDEVVVAFELGDTNFPVILGAVWNGSDPPPDQANQSADNNVRTIVTRSGHELTFDDTSGSEKVTLKTQGGHQIVLDDAPGQGKISLQTSGGQSLTLDDTPPGSVSLQTSGGAGISMSDAGDVTISAPVSLTLKSPTITLQAALAMTLVTNGNMATSAIVIENKPFGTHTHTGGTILPAGVTGPVAPV